MVGTNWKPFAKRVLAAIGEAGIAERSTLVLIGSAARGTSTWRSDIDLLLILPEDVAFRWRPPAEVHLQRETRKSFARHIHDGDDFPIWALRFGRPVHDPDGWWAAEVAHESLEPHWPDWTTKVKRASEALARATALLEMGDREAAEEEYLYALSHAARAGLLKHGEFPLSRPELPGQLARFDHVAAQALQELLTGGLTAKQLQRIDLVAGSVVTALSDEEILSSR